MASISIITPSIRKEGLKLVEKALNQQTFRDFEWLINDKRYEGGYWGLNRAYNDLIRQSKGDLIVSWQDYTYAKPDTLERLWQHYQDNPKTLVGLVGNKYLDTTWTTITWKDPRERNDQGSFYECFFPDIEWNLCAIPKQALYDVGGFDEELDYLGFGMDGYSVNDRINTLGGYEFRLDQSLKTYSVEHPRPTGWDENNLINGGYIDRRQSLIDKRYWPVLKFL